MNPGRELDALVAEKVMYLEDIQKNDGGEWEYFDGPETVLMKRLPSYSTDIAAAMEIVYYIRGESRLYDFELWIHGDNSTTATFITDKKYHAFSDESAAHAICLAALKALGVEV